MRDLCLYSDEKVRTLADDLLFQTNSFTNIDGLNEESLKILNNYHIGAGGSTWYALQTTGDNLEVVAGQHLSIDSRSYS